MFYNDRRYAYACWGKYEEALADCDSALALKPDLAPPYRHAGITREKKCDLEKALQSYTKAVQLNPEYADRARIYLALGEPENAAEDEETAARISRQP